MHLMSGQMLSLFFLIINFLLSSTPFLIPLLQMLILFCGVNVLVINVPYVINVKPFFMFSIIIIAQSSYNVVITILGLGLGLGHNSVLSLLYNAAVNHLPHQFNIFADLKNCEVIFPSDIISTAQMPDMLIWNNHTLKFYVIELTIPFETNFFDANKRKLEWYTDFIMTIKSKASPVANSTFKLDLEALLMHQVFSPP